MKILSIRFFAAVHIGRGMYPTKFLCNEHLNEKGAKIPASNVGAGPVKITPYDTMFLRIDLEREGYSQLIPWTQVESLLFEECKKKKKDEPNSK